MVVAGAFHSVNVYTAGDLVIEIKLKQFALMLC